MCVKSIGLVWIAVKDFKKAVKFYTEIVGLQIVEENEQFGWAELQGHEGGAKLGLAQIRKESDQIGKNAVLTFTVENLEKAKEDLIKGGANCVGDPEEVPGHVILQMAVDNDGNRFQLAQFLH